MSISPQPAAVEEKPLEPEDRAALAGAHQRLHQMQVSAALLGVFFALGAWYMAGRGQPADAYAGGAAALLMWACAVALGVMTRRDTHRGTKQVIRGVIEDRKVMRTRYNVRFYLRVGGMDVAVPPDVFRQFREGQSVCVERTSGSRSLLRVRALP